MKRPGWNTFAFRIPPDMLTRVRDTAASEGINAGEFIRRAVVMELDRAGLARLHEIIAERNTPKDAA